MAELTLKDFENKIKQLILVKDYSGAFKLCQEILRLDPNNVSILRLQNEIQKKVKKRNQKIIVDEITRNKQLLASGQYEEFLKQMGKLQPYATDFPEIESLILEGSRKLQDSYQTKKEDFVRGKLKEVEQLIANKEYHQAIALADQLIQFNYQIPQIRSLANSIRAQLIQEELNKNQALLNTNKFEDINLFLLELQKIDPQNKTVEKLIQKNKTEARLNSLDNQKDFIYKTVEEIRNLEILKKYDQALELSVRLLNIDPDSVLFKNMRNKYFQKINQNAQTLIASQIKSNYPVLLQKFKSNPGDFITV